VAVILSWKKFSVRVAKKQGIKVFSLLHVMEVCGVEVKLQTFLNSALGGEW
jgi:hypothetical protein